MSTEKYLAVSVKLENKKVRIFLKNISSRIIIISSLTIKGRNLNLKQEKFYSLLSPLKKFQAE